MHRAWLAAASLAALGPAGDRVAFAPAEGSSATKTFDSSVYLEMDDLSVSAGGQEIDPSMLGDPEVSLDVVLHTAVFDEYEEIAEGRPARLVRTFERADMQVETSFSSGRGSDGDTQSATSALEGSSVAFTWSDDEDGFVTAWEDGGGDDDLLEGLWEDMDLRGVLPDGEVEVGDTWPLDTGALSRVLAPGGDLAYEPEDGPDGAELPEEVAEALEGRLRELLEGEALATYQGVRERDGEELAFIDLVVEIDSTVDLGDVIEEVVEIEGGDADVSFGRADVEVLFDGEGVLTWNVAARRFHSLELSGEATVGLDLWADGADMGSLDVSVEFSGSMSFSASAH